MKGMATVLVVVAGMWGCAGGGARVIAPADEATAGRLIERVKGLEGTWTMEGPDGTSAVASVFKVSSGGSVVREIMFPGDDHEMTNVYHMDGADLVMTHYCAAGNQPRMRSQGADEGVIELGFDSVTNLTNGDGYYMGSMRLVFVDANHIRQEWTSYSKGKVVGQVTFELTRKE